MLDFLLANTHLYACLVFFASIACCYIVMPSVISVSNCRNLMADTNHRSSHVRKTPTLGGVAFFICMMLVLFFLSPVDTVGITNSIMSAITVLFVVGLKDDLTVLSARTKFFAQLIAIGFVLFNKSMLITSLHGFMGIYEIPWVVAVVGSVFLVVAIVNAYNLIDGIDGLAGGIGTLISVCFFVAFYSVELYYFAFIGLISAGYLIGFLKFNLSHKNKIFMGDTGSLIAGFVLGIMTIRLLAMNADQIVQLHIKPANLFVMIGMVLFVPFLDTVRVFSIRLLKGKSPFVSDKNHIHHLLLNYGFKHLTASVLLISINAFGIVGFYLMNLYVSTSVFLILFSTYSISMLLVLLKYKIMLHRKLDIEVHHLYKEGACSMWGVKEKEGKEELKEENRLQNLGLL